MSVLCRVGGSKGEKKSRQIKNRKKEKERTELHGRIGMSLRFQCSAELVEGRNKGRNEKEGKILFRFAIALL